MTALVRQFGWESLRTVKNRQFLFGSIAMPLIFYFIFVNVIGANKQLNGTSWKTYYLMSMAAFSTIGACLFGLSARIAYERTQGWLRLVQTTPLSNAAYMSTKFFSQFLINSMSTIALFVVGGVSQGVHLTVAQWILCALWLVFGSLPFIAIGLLLGIALTVETTNIAANILNLALGILGGLWWPTDVMSKTLQNIAKWMPSYRFAHVDWDLAAGNLLDWNDIVILLAYTLVFAGLTRWVLRRQEERDA